jgi:alkylation response protein AidB-like acyl-CoA dehydrogenase
VTAAEHHDREGDARIDPGVACTLDELLPLVRRRIEEIRATRRLPDDVELGLRAAGVNRMLLPAELGGLETPTSAIIGAASNIFAGYLRIEGAAEVFADPDRSRATRFAPLGTLHESPDGSLRLDGRWPFVSNCHHAEWIGLGATLRRDRGGTDPVPRLAFVRAADITIEDTWDVVGLRVPAATTHRDQPGSRGQAVL